MQTTNNTIDMLYITTKFQENDKPKVNKDTKIKSYTLAYLSSTCHFMVVALLIVVDCRVLTIVLLAC